MMEIVEALLSDYHTWLIALGVVAVGAAIWGVITHRLIARRQLTVEIIYRQQTNSETILAKQTLVSIAKKEGESGLAHYAEEDLVDSNETKSIQSVLNQFELFAVGIELGILDYEIYKRYYKSNSIRFYHLCAPFIHALRSRLKNDNLYHEFEQLTWWLKERKIPKRRLWRGLFF